jgi:hypothetical protein
MKKLTVQEIKDLHPGALMGVERHLLYIYSGRTVWPAVTIKYGFLESSRIINNIKYISSKVDK